jgi:hypothetical protein
LRGAIEIRTKTTLYLSLIIGAFLIQSVANPFPFTQYGLDAVLVALFVPYFGFKNSLKIIVVLTSLSIFMALPTLLAVSLTWSDTFNGLITITAQIHNQKPKLTFHPVLAPAIATFDPILYERVLQTKAFFFSFLLASCFTESIVGLYILHGLFEKLRVYKRIEF